MAQSKTGKLIGYARVSTDDQLTEAQAQALKAAGCTEIHEERPPAATGRGPFSRGSSSTSSPACAMPAN